MLKLKVSVKKIDILLKLKENKIKHFEEYEAAELVYRKEKIARLKSALKKAISFCEGKSEQDSEVYQNVGLQKPIDNSEKYDELIASFELVSDEVLELDFDDTKHIANDTFPWLDASKFVNAMYSSRR